MVADDATHDERDRDPASADAAIDRVLSEKRVSNYELTVCRDTDETVVSYNAATFHDRDDKLQGVFAAARDVTEGKRVEVELKQKGTVKAEAFQVTPEMRRDVLKRLRARGVDMADPVFEGASSLIEEQLASRVQGSLHVGRIHGSLLTGVRIDSLEIRGPDDSLFVATGPVTVEYDPRDLLDRRLLLRHVRVERPVVHLRRYDDGTWNFRRIFPPGPPSAPRVPRQRGFGDFVVMDSATVVGGQFLLTMPWRPADSLRGARLDSAIAYNLGREEAEIHNRADSLVYSTEKLLRYMALMERPVADYGLDVAGTEQKKSPPPVFRDRGGWRAA